MAARAMSMALTPRREPAEKSTYWLIDRADGRYRCHDAGDGNEHISIIRGPIEIWRRFLPALSRRTTACGTRRTAGHDFCFIGRRICFDKTLA